MGDYLNIGKYVIPLDAVDLSLLPLENILQIETNDYRPLWCKRDFDQRNEVAYYKFEIQERSDEPEPAKIEDESLHEEDNIEFKTNKCFICNLEVPQPYMENHIHSYKHEMFLTLTNIALDRVKKNMNQIFHITNTNTSLYFCETCVSVMSIHHRSTHDQSDLHKKEMERDTAFKNLIYLYTNEDVNLLDNALLESKGINTNNSNGNNLESQDISNDIEIENEETTPAKYDSSNIPIVLSYVLQCVDEDHYILQIIGDCDVKVDFDNFHGFDKLTKRRYQCKLCPDTFKKRQKHVASEKHIKRIKTDIKDRHCVRTLNSSKKHCILCNVLVEVDDEHINEESHIERLQEAIVKPEEENVTENSETKKTECDAPRETTNIPSNAKVKKRKRKAQLDGRDEKYVKNEKYVKDKKHAKDDGENKYSNEDRDDQDDKDDLDEMDGKENVDGKNDKAGKVVTDCQSCEICKLEKECWDDNDSKVDEEGHDDNDGRIDKDDKDTKVDNNGKKDKVLLTESKVATKESGDNCSLPEATQACCDVCNIVMHASNLLAHAAGKRHKNNERHSIHYLMHKSPDEDFFSCEICETHVNLKEIQRHLADSEHTYKYRALLSQNEISKIEDQVLFCDPCLMFMTKGNEVDHVRSNRHKAALKPKVHSCQQSEQVTSMKTEEKEPEISFSAVSSSTRSNNRRLYDPYDQSQERDMHSDDESYLHGRKQSSVSILAQRRKEIMRLRGITGTGEKIQIQDDNVQNNTLEICLVAESSKRIDNKESDRPVKSTVLKVKTKIDKSTCTEIVYDEETENSIRDLKTRVFEVQSKLKEVLYTKPPEQLMEVMYGGSGVACKLCKTILRNDELNIGFHINDLKHKKTESKVFEINKLRKKGEAFYCEFCAEDISAGKQFVHMECDTHKNNFLKEKHQVSNVTAAKCTRDDNNANDVDNDHDKPSTSKNNKSEKCKRYELIHDVKSDELRCQFCEVTVPNTASSINKHIRSFSHYNQKEIFLTVNDIVRNRNLLVCVLCSHEFAETYLFNHVKEEMHVELIGVKKSPETINDFCLICGVYIGEKFNMYDHSITQQHLINYREVMIEERYECEVCNVFMTNNKKRIQKHEAGTHHIKSLKLLNDNSIVIRNGRYSCGLCQEHFLWEEIMDHVTSPKHLSNTSKGM